MAAKSWKEWEKPLIELDDALAKLKSIAHAAEGERRQELERKIAEYEKRRDNYIAVMYSRLGPWEKVLVARAEPRPYSLDYVNAICDEFLELQGDRRAGADNAVIGGLAVLGGRSVMILGQQKGRNIQERQHRNFAMAKPEGYRKAIRLMEMANRFNLPVISFVDTPAADPGVESETRGISESIAAAQLAMLDLRVPAITIIIGEGGSGGAIAIACGNRVLMQEHAIYSVIPPEGCAAILWRAPEKGPQAAAALRLTAQAAHELGMVDEVLPEPFGGAHRDPIAAAQVVGAAILAHLEELSAMSPDEIYEHRIAKYRAMGHIESGLLGQAVVQGG